ncbi:MAG TPA: alpha/beta fold hydrolase [Ktedonobacterales bacterium]
MGEREEMTYPATGAPVRCILVHGFNGEPVDMCELEASLAARGFATTTLLLPGHGTSVRDFAAARWEHWADAVNAEVRAALARGERVIPIGHSMGGALAFAAAEREPGVAGVVALCAPIALDTGPRGSATRRYRWLPPYVLSLGDDVRDRVGVRRRYERHAYRLVPLATARSLFDALPAVRDLLPAVTCPTLLIYARNDHVVPLKDGIAAYKCIGAQDKQLAVLPRSFHAVTKDVERHLVCERVTAFCERLRAAALPPADATASGKIDRIC